MIISLIYAASENNVIGKDNTLPWHLPADMKYFKGKTIGHCIVTGRKNYDSIPEKFRPLPDRTNIIVTHQKNYIAPNTIIVNTIPDALKMAEQKGETECFIIGGADIFRQTIHLANKIYLTKIHHSFEGDTFAPELDLKQWKEIKHTDFQPDEKNKYAYSFIELVNA